MSPLLFNSRKGCRYLSFLLVFLFVFSCMQNLVLADDEKESKNEDTDSFSVLDLTEVFGKGAVDRVSSSLSVLLLIGGLLVSISPLLLSSFVPASMTSLTSPVVIIVLIVVSLFTLYSSYASLYVLLSSKGYIVPILNLMLPMLTIALMFSIPLTGLVSLGTDLVVRSFLLILSIVHVGSNFISLSMLFLKTKSKVSDVKEKIFKAVKAMETLTTPVFDKSKLELSTLDSKVNELKDLNKKIKILSSETLGGLPHDKCKKSISTWISDEGLKNIDAVKTSLDENLKDTKKVLDDCKSKDGATEEQKKTDSQCHDYFTQLFELKKNVTSAQKFLKSVSSKDDEESSKK